MAALIAGLAFVSVKASSSAASALIAGLAFVAELPGRLAGDRHWRGDRHRENGKDTC